jgi:hypothetical protein
LVVEFSDNYWRPGVNLMKKQAAGAGIGIGTVVAAVLSWSANHSIFWIIVHAFLGWIYVIYYALFK